MQPDGPATLRLLIAPAVLTALAIPVHVIAWYAGDEYLLTTVFWQTLMWAGALLYFTGLLADRRLRAAPG